MSGKVCSDKVWVWGGPTSKWGGTMEKDCLVKGADYFRAKNIMYLHGPINDEMINIFKQFKKVICQLTHINRNPGAQIEDDVANAEKLSEFSLRYKNIVGGIIDDLSTNLEKFSPEKLRNIHSALTKHNSSLELYGVVYTEGLLHIDFKKYLPFIDVINLWVWKKSNLRNLDRDIKRCQQIFPDKPIILGLYIHDYGESDKAMPIDLLAYQFNKAKEYIQQRKIDSFVILGDREIKKHPSQAGWIRNFLEENFLEKNLK